MAKPNKHVSKTVEVIWNRSSNNRGTKSLPRMKEINIDDSVIKVKKSKCKYLSHGVGTNEISHVEHAERKHVKRSLFQEKKKEKAYERSNTDKSKTASRMSCPKSPQIMSNREILERNQNVSFRDSEQKLFQTEGIKNVDFLALRRNTIRNSTKSPRKRSKDLSETSQMSCPKSPEIMSNREMLEKNQNISFRGSKQKLFQTKGIKNVDFLASRRNTTRNSTKSPRKRSKDLSETSQMSCPKSPEIMSNREMLEKNQNVSFHNVEPCLLQAEIKRTVELSATHKKILGSKFLPKTKKIGIEDNGTIEIKTSFKSDCFSRKINEISDKCGRKLVRRSLFQENRKLCGPGDSNEGKNTTHLEPFNSLRTRSDSLPEVSQMSCPKSPQISSNRGILERNRKNTSCPKSNSRLFQIKSAKNAELLLSHSVGDASNDIKCLRTADQIRRGSKSPEIMTNRRRRYTEYNGLDDVIVSSYHDNLNTKPVKQASIKSENVHSSKVQLPLKSVDSEDIIESSEMIYVPKKQKSKKKKHKRIKVKNCNDKCQVRELKRNGKDETKLERNEFTKSTKIMKTNENNMMCDEIDSDSLDIINTENVLKSPVIDLKIKRNQKKPIVKSRENSNRHITRSIEIENDTVVPRPSFSAGSKEFAEQSDKEDFKTFNTRRTERCLNPRNEGENKLFTYSTEVNLIPSTPDGKADKLVIEDYSSGTICHLNSYVPLIEVDQSPKIQHENDRSVHIQCVRSPPNLNDSVTTSPDLFEPLVSPTQSTVNSALMFKIDSVESPCATYENDNFVSPVSRKKKPSNSPSPDHFNSVKKRKKVCKDGLRVQFRDLINRKKSEACIREYEKISSKSYRPKHDGDTTLLNVIEVWKEFQTFVLLCYHRKSDTEDKKVLVTLDNCPRNVAKNSVIRIYSPWLTIESKIAEVLLFVGVTHAEVIESSGSLRSVEPIGLITNPINWLRTTMCQSEVLWKCDCSKETTCQCLGELSVYNYLQYMISQ